MQSKDARGCGVVPERAVLDEGYIGRQLVGNRVDKASFFRDGFDPNRKSDDLGFGCAFSP
jgi:hypothetical protein